MEAEIVRMGINLFHGGEDACGTVRNDKDCLMLLFIRL